MSVINYAMKLFSSASTATAACPVCGLKSAQPLSKIRLNQAMLCPGCKSLFIFQRQFE
ncbi:YnfU family zinc-binding protein [Citrobacter sp. CK197]|nr:MULTISPECIES: YnfU family zinc-binding protein [Enterobacterales]MDM2817572.1 YnfU family zinc-binding protein [Citrobacter sp. Cpo102]MDM2983494.1 YnfU family zinc-binding protein [Citrobacter sp. CK197]MDM2999102.1 YnfU family zinc-binding protein [Citrobacter sp. CK192]MDM3022565.1 YnfU family zinc-binding protein [Citrobacter sp. CK193]MEB2702892.1 YnfU family zinc-binding protein [Citrobacter koseri]